MKLSTGAEFPFPGGSSTAPLRPESILPIDFNYDFKTDLVLAGEGGVRFLRQESPSSFTDVTAQTKLPPALLNAAYTSAWAIDVEADGDMDILLATQQGDPLVLRNNGDGTFAAIHPFNGVKGLRGLAWVDMDDDGNPDAALIDGAGSLHFFHNQRGGVFNELPLPANLPPVKAVTVADVSSSGTLDLVALEPSGALVAITRTDETWKVVPLGSAPRLASEVRLHAADLDNNGAVDLLVVPVAPNPGDPPGASIWLNSGAGKFTLLPNPAGSPRVFAVADINADGRLDLLGLSPNGEPQQALSHGSKNYHWQILRPRARVATGDQRINSFGIGGEIALRSGLLLQKQAIASPQLHFGLGEQTIADVVTILWPNGMQNAEFALKADQEVLTEQRLKGSCPFLFAWNGKEMSFVKDAVPWGSAIGLQIDSVGSPGIAATEEWYKIRGDQLAPHHGYYDLRLTGELWETYYYDYLKLMVVDHPAGTEIFTDERFVVPAPKLAITTVAPPHNITKAVDDQGTDVTAIVTNLDGDYLDTFGRGQYQGLTRDHYVEIDLGDDVPASGPLWLIAKGWVHPTDSSVNLAIGQGHHEKATTTQSRSSRWSRWMAHRPGKPRLPGRPQEDLPHQPGERLPARHTAQIASAHQSRSLLGSDPVGAGLASDSTQNHAPRSIPGQPALPRIFRRQPGQRLFSRTTQLQPHRRHHPDLARPRRLLHALRRRAAAAVSHRRSLRDHERRRRNCLAISPSSLHPRPVGSETT